MSAVESATSRSLKADPPRRVSDADAPYRLSPEPYGLFPSEPVYGFSPTEPVHTPSPPDTSAMARPKERRRTSSAELTHRMSPTERANMIFSKETIHRTLSVDVPHNFDHRMLSEQDLDEPMHKKSKTDSSQISASIDSVMKVANTEQHRRQSSQEPLRRLSSESETNS
jgi:hypothetical protein